MSDHLPECPVNNIDIAGLCMCHELRACEERVEESMDQAWAKAVVEIEAHARSLALDAAREAVKAASVRNDTSYAMRMRVLAAIDALKGKP